ncbi:acyltransferase [bacterium]|nr:acyltransferase [bacterium]
MSQGPQPAYFPGLNGIRALAASLVILWHTDEFAYLFGLPSYGYGETGMAGCAVTLFFVLSGFLITFLLLKEKDKYGSVSVGKFYGRRILRIWPVYYLAVAGGLGLFRHLSTEQGPPSHAYWLAYSLYIFLMPNVAYAFGLGVRSIKPLWSVGVEEQFYLVWPWLVKKSRNLLVTLGLILLAVISLKVVLRFTENGPFYQLIRLTAIDSMAVGGVGGWLVHRRHPWLSYVYSRPAQIAAWSFLAISILYRPLQITSMLDSELHALVFVVLILNVSTNPATMVTLENRPANFLGRISYGLYVYHMPLLCILGQYLGPVIQPLQPASARLGLVILIVYGCSVALAWFSYRFIESRFLAYKQQLAKVPSTDRAQSTD